MVWTFLITIIVTKIITVISVITVLLTCAGDVQKVDTKVKLLCLHNQWNNNITNDVWILNENMTDNNLISTIKYLMEMLK